MDELKSYVIIPGSDWCDVNEPELKHLNVHESRVVRQQIWDNVVLQFNLRLCKYLLFSLEMLSMI